MLQESPINFMVKTQWVSGSQIFPTKPIHRMFWWNAVAGPDSHFRIMSTRYSFLVPGLVNKQLAIENGHLVRCFTH